MAYQMQQSEAFNLDAIGNMRASVERTMAEHIFEIVQYGIVVAKTSASSRKKAQAEAMHYAMQYRQDGPVILREVNPKGASGVEINFSQVMRRGISISNGEGRCHRGQRSRERRRS